jgi:hypothetical protein
MEDIQVHNAHDINELQLLQVMGDMENRGIKRYTVRPGNNCIWVSYNLVDCYYLFRDGRIFDLQFD